MPSVILGSSSPYRAELLARLAIPFTQIAPDIDETRRPHESAHDYVERLAIEKAQAIALSHPEALVIGSDQCSECRGVILGKPQSRERAIQQLSSAAGQAVVIWTGVAVYNPATQTSESRVVTTTVQFRALDRGAIERYVDQEQPLDCAGAFKAEGLGITLFESIQGDDPNALIGLPLIALTTLMANAGIARP